MTCDIKLALGKWKIDFFFKRNKLEFIIKQVYQKKQLDHIVQLDNVFLISVSKEILKINLSTVCATRSQDALVPDLAGVTCI